MIWIVMCAGLLTACEIKVKGTIATDCAWYRKVPPLSKPNADHFQKAPDKGNAAAFFDVVRDNRRKNQEFCQTTSPK